METTVYLIRHSVRFKNKELIESYKTNQSNLLKNEKIILSIKGEKRADILSDEKELQNLDAIYTSNCVRTLQTAKYFLYKQKLKVNIDDRFDERRVGQPNDDEVKDWFFRQYEDENYKTVGGESQVDVKNRMLEALSEIVKENKGKRIAIFSHGYAITFLLLKWCNLEGIKKDPNGGYQIKYTYKGKTLFDKKINSPDVFKLILNEDNEVIDVKNIVFDDLEYDDFFCN